MLKLGPKEIKGTIWDEYGKSRIVQILISYDEDSIRSIQFVDSYDGDLRQSRIHGKPDGLKFDMVTLDYPSEFLTSVSGEYGNNRLVSMGFGTNKRKFGPFGRIDTSASASSFIAYEIPNKKFEYKFGPRSCFLGFHGSIQDCCVHAIGIYVRPIESSFELLSIYDGESSDDDKSK